MNRNSDIGNELSAISPAVANLSSRMPFRIPEGYFELFPERMMLLIKAQIPVISTPFSVPEGYFEGLSGNILSKIKNLENETAADEINRISPVLAELNKVNPFVLPEGYFENLEILAAVNPLQEEKSRVVAMGSWKKWMNYAAAAVITALLAGAVYFTISSSGNSDMQLNPPVAQIDTPENDSLNLSQEALSGFLEQTNSPVAEDLLEAAEIMEQKDLAILEVSENSIQSALENLEDDAIQDYILENPDTGMSKDSN